METFTFGLGNGWWFRALGRNPLVRRSDRIEALMVVLAVLLTVVAIPIAGAIGTSVHDMRTRQYAEEAQTKHQVTATAIKDGTVGMDGEKDVFTAKATWSVAGQPHTGEVVWPNRPRIGAQQSIWIDAIGKNVMPPSSPSRATADALAMAASVFFGVAGASAGLVYVVRRQLDRWRYAEWDRELYGTRESRDRRKNK